MLAHLCPRALPRSMLLRTALTECYFWLPLQANLGGEQRVLPPQHGAHLANRRHNRPARQQDGQQRPWRRGGRVHRQPCQRHGMR